MRSKHLYIPLLAILLFVSANDVSAQQILYNTPKFLQRLQIGYTFSNTFAQQKRADHYFSGIEGDTIFVTNPESRTVRNLGGYGFSIGKIFPLTDFNTTYIGLAVTADFTYDFMSWEELDSGFSYRPTLKEHKRTDFTLQMGLPVSLDLKLGAEAVPSFNHKWSAGFGAGVTPVIVFTDQNRIAKNIFKNADYINGGYMPFIKFEYGQRVGVLMKLRFFMYFGGPEYLRAVDTYGADFGLNSYSLKGKTSMNLSLSVFPFSYTWPEFGWWQ